MVMKMAAVSSVSLLLLCCHAISSADSQEACHLFGEVGKNFTVPLVHALGFSDLLRWKHDGRVIFYQKSALVLTGTKEDVSVNGSLKLRNLKKSDAGIYTPEIHDENGRGKGTFNGMRLCVLDRPPTPSVRVKCSGPSVIFTCDVQPQLVKDLSFGWLQNNKVLKEEKGQTLKRTADLVVTDSFSCRVSNPAVSTIGAPVKHGCKLKFIFPEQLFGVNTWIFVGAGGGVVVLLIIIVIVCCVRAKRKKRMQLKDEGELRLAWTSDAQQQHQHHHHHHQQQQPAGHTGPRHQSSKQHRDQRRPRAPGEPGAQPQPSPRRPAQVGGHRGPVEDLNTACRPLQASRPAGKYDDEQPPPLPQPRKKAAKTARV